MSYIPSRGQLENVLRRDHIARYFMIILPSWTSISQLEGECQDWLYLIFLVYFIFWKVQILREIA